MLTARDKRLIIHLGYHKQLTHKQMGLLEFPSKEDHLEYSYQSLQRRIREEFLPNKIFSNPLYLDIDKETKAIYKLDDNGRKLFKMIAGENTFETEFNFRYTPRLIQINDILVELKRNNIIGIDDFKIEYKTDYNVIDVLIDLKCKYLAIEIDYHETDWKKEIQNKYSQYTKINLNKPLELLYYTNRMNQLKEWLNEVWKPKLNPYYIERNPQLTYRLIKENIICHT